MLTFDQYPAEIGVVSFSSEIHGNETRTIASIFIEAVVNAANLQSFKPGLQEAFWYRPAINDSARLDDNGEVHELVRRFPTIKTINFEDKLGRGYQLDVSGDLLDDTKSWADMDIAKVWIQPQDGGTARIGFRAQARGEGLEWWVGLINQARTITLKPPHNPLPAGHPDAPRDDDPLSGSLEFGRDAQPPGEDAGDDADEAGDDTDVASANGSTDPLPDGVTQRTVEGLAEADRDIAAKRARADPPKGKRNGKSGAALTH